MSDFVDRMMRTISQIESSGGKNLKHKMVTTGINAGDTAHGQYGLMPKTIKDIARIDKSINKEYPEIQNMSNSEIYALLNKNTELEDRLVRSHITRLTDNFGEDPKKIGYAWLNGVRGTYKAMREGVDIEGHWHAKKIARAFEKVEPVRASRLPASIDENPGIMKKGALMDKTLLEKLRTENEDFVNRLVGQGKFKDTGRSSENFGEALDSITGAPLRVLIRELQDGNFNFSTLKKALNQVAKDPKNAPDGVDIALRVTNNPYVGAALATLMDLSQIPTPVGVAGKIEDVTKPATKILEEINTVEKALKLKGAERGQYLKALDEVYGTREARAKEMGFGDKTWYHGTSDDFDRFRADKLGSHTGGGTTKDRFWFSDNPAVASEFGDSAAKIREMRKAHAMEDDLLRSGGSDAAYDAMIAENRKKIKDIGGAVMPVKIRSSGLKEKDMGGKVWMKDASEIPEGGVILKNFYENAGPESGTPLGTSLGTLNATKIRSVNAAFDPRFKDSDKLLAGKTITGARGVNMDNEQNNSNSKSRASSMLVDPVEQREQAAAAYGFRGLQGLYDHAVKAMQPEVNMFNEAGAATNEFGFTDKLTVDPKKAGAVERVSPPTVEEEDKGPSMLSQLGAAASSAGSKLMKLLEGDPNSSFANKKVRYLGK